MPALIARAVPVGSLRLPACLLALLGRMAYALQFREVRQESRTTRPPRVRNRTRCVQIRTTGRLWQIAAVLRKCAKVRRRGLPQRWGVAPLWIRRPAGVWRFCAPRGAYWSLWISRPAGAAQSNDRGRASEQTPCRPAGPPAYVVARSVPLHALCRRAGPRLAGLQSPCHRAGPPRAQVQSPRGRFTISRQRGRGRTPRPTGGGGATQGGIPTYGILRSLSGGTAGHGGPRPT